MGNKCGWLATYSAVAGGGNMVIVPEEEFDKEKSSIKYKNYMMVVNLI